MAYSALTIDTNILYGHGFDFEHGLVGQLSQFKGAPTPFLLSEIVRREFFKHVFDQTNAAHGDLTRAANKARAKGVVLVAQHAGVEQVVAALADPGAAALTQVNNFIAMTAATVVPDDPATLGEVTRLYFAGEPPFEPTGPKKDEFPDAIALLALEGWARKNGTVLAVSRDAGWAQFAQTSALIDVVRDLKLALQMFQDQAEALANTVSDLIVRMSPTDVAELQTDLIGRMTSRLEELDPELDATSQHYFEAELAGVTVNDFSLIAKEDGGYVVTIVRHTPEETVFTVPFKAELTIDASFSLRHYDREDREYISLGHENRSTAITIRDEAMVTLGGSLEDPDELFLEDADIVGRAPSVDFGDLEIS